jgi:LPXTG-motif cell wall-anchored protein
MKKHFGTRRPRVIRSLMSVMAVVLVAFGLPLVTMSAASAHTPNLTKSCNGVTVKGSYYEATDTNTLGIRIDQGPWATKTFATTDSLTAAVPQDGLSHTYDAYVHTTNRNPDYSQEFHGTVGPCGTQKVQPVTPTITNPACTGPGTHTSGSFTLPANGNGISYTKSGNVVTATADTTHSFLTVPAGWTLVTSHKATYTVTYTNPPGYPDCLVQLPTPVAPVAAAPTCNTDGDLVVGTTPHVVTRVDNVIVSQNTHYGPGSHVVSYTAASGYTFADGTAKSFTVNVKPKTLDCPVTPVNPTVTQSVCTGPGTHSQPVVTFGDVPGDHISYAYDAGTHVVTATPEAGFALANLPAGWHAQKDGTATFQVNLVDPGACLVEVPVPTTPVASAPTCNTDGDLVVGTTPHVVTRVDNVIITQDTHFGPGDHALSYTAAEGYTFPSGTVKTLTVKVKAMTLDCPVTPVSPTVTQSVCTGPGTHSDPVVTFGDVPGDHITYAYDAVNHVVTATPETGFALAHLPAGWVSHDNGTATFHVTLTDPGLCLVDVPVPTPPVPTAPTCDTDGTLTVAPTEHVLTTVDDTVIEGETAFGPGEHTITYAPAEGYTFGEQVVEPVVVTVLPKTNDCPAGVVSPTVTQSVCTGPGTHSEPVVTLGDVEGDHVSYVYDAGTHVVTATADKGFALANLPTGWTMQENRTATYLVTLTDPGPCLVTVVSPPTTSPAVQVQGPKAHHPTVLPNTGGPNQWLALAGLVLLLGGGALVSRERRLRRREG